MTDHRRDFEAWRATHPAYKGIVNPYMIEPMFAAYLAALAHRDAQPTSDGTTVGDVVAVMKREWERGKNLDADGRWLLLGVRVLGMIVDARGQAWTREEIIYEINEWNTGHGEPRVLADALLSRPLPAREVDYEAAARRLVSVEGNGEQFDDLDGAARDGALEAARAIVDAALRAEGGGK